MEVVNIGDELTKNVPVEGRNGEKEVRRSACSMNPPVDENG